MKPLKPNEIFTFGSNEAGRHGKGAALTAKNKYGAIYSQAYGLQGRSFGIPTKDRYLRTLPLTAINSYVNMFIQFAIEHPELIFRLTPIGCGLAGYDYDDIAPMFKDAPSNVILPREFENVLEEGQCQFTIT